MNKIFNMKKVIIYTTSRCLYCLMAKDYLTRKGVSFEERNVEEDQDSAREMILKSGQFGVPVIDINGKIIVGFRPKEIDEALES